MTPAYVTTFAPTAQDLVDASRRATLRTYLVIFGSCLIALGVILWSDGLSAIAVGLIAGLIVSLLGPLVLVPRRLRRTFVEQRSAGEERTVRFYDDRFESNQASGSMTVPWRDFVKWDEDRRIMLVYLNRNAMTMLPKRAFSDEAIGFARSRLVAAEFTKPRRRRR